MFQIFNFFIFEFSSWDDPRERPELKEPVRVYRCIFGNCEPCCPLVPYNNFLRITEDLISLIFLRSRFSKIPVYRGSE